MEGERELSDAWTSFTRFVLLKEGPPEGYTWSGERLTRKHTTSRPDDVWPDMWKLVSDAVKRKAQQRWAFEKPKLDDARPLRGIFFIEPDDEEFKFTIKAARRKLEVPMPALQNTDKEQWSYPPQYWETQVKNMLVLFRSHLGSSHFLFKCARCFSRSRAFLVLSCPNV